MNPNESPTRFDPLLPEFFPLKLIGAFISVDFIVGCSFACRFCISRRHPAREALFEAGLALEHHISPRQVMEYLATMPSYRAGVQLRIGHDTDAGLEFEPAAQLIDLVGPDRSVVYLTRRPMTLREVEHFGRYRPNLLLKLTATPRSRSLGVHADPLALISSTAAIDERMKYWVVGPLASDSVEDAERILEALPAGSHLFLKALNTDALPSVRKVKPMPAADMARLEAIAAGRGHVVTEFFCRRSLARVGRGFFDVDKITSQPPGAKRERELAVCAGCPSRTLCHGEVDLAQFTERLHEELARLGLTLAAQPRRVAARSFEVSVVEPSSRGEETYLNQVLGLPVNITLSTRERGRSQGGSFCNVDPAVLRRWEERGFLPVAALRDAARETLSAVRAALARSDGLPAAFRPDGASHHGGSTC